MDFKDIRRTTVFDKRQSLLGLDTKERICLQLPHKGSELYINCDIAERGITKGKGSLFQHPYPLFTRLFAFRNGSAEIKTDKGSITMTAGNIYILPSGKSFVINYAERELIYFHLLIHDRGGGSIFSRDDPIYCICAPVMIEALATAFASSNIIAIQATVISCLSEVMTGKLDNLANQTYLSQEFSPIFKYLEDHPPATVTMEELAALYGISSSALSKRFKRKMKISLKEYLIEQQLLQASELLLHSSYRVYEIAKMLGHHDIQYFYRFFKKHTGKTPSEFRQSSGNT